MYRPLAVIGLVLSLACPAFAVPTARTSGTHHSSSSSSKPKVYVKGYYRKDGTYVAPHYRVASGTSPSTGSPKPPSTTTPRTPAPGSSTSPHTGGCKTCPRDAHGRILRNPAAHAQFLRQTGYPHGRPGYVVDHIIPLECGGADSPSNMQWQTIAEARAKDRTERNCRR
jgi:hypothetical protein